MSGYNIAYILEYDGSSFFGFQKQHNTRTIQGEIERVLSIFTNEDITITTAGRTDTGVHATHQVINFQTNANRTLEGFVRGVNALLPHDIVIHKAIYVNNDFNARFHALSRTYTYYLLNSKIRPSVLHGKVGWYHAPLDTAIMNTACNMLLGTHDFSSLRAVGCSAKNPIRTIFNIETATNPSILSTITDQNILSFKFRANGFLYHMIRNIMGSLIYVGSGKISLMQFEELLHQKNRIYSPPTFMADGLYLTGVEYLSEYNIHL